MSYNSNLPEDITVSRVDIRENLRALKEDKIVDAATAVVADSAAKLTNARKVSLEGDATGSSTFDGSADVTIQVDVLSADVATKLETARTINGVEFDGTKDITITVDTVGGYKPNDLMPLGAVIMWSGSIDTIPSKWALCNGSNGTPDLRDKFVVGAGKSYSLGATGGEAKHTLSINEMPSHNHNFMLRAQGDTTSTATPVYNDILKTPSSELQNYQVNTSYIGGNQSHENRPPYYALAYIIRIA
ncbi:MAG: hypothetical protein H6Q70_299 [Firmicutes bacterium]|nr:hypothetical protein [Bacillota bacterium]